MIVGVNAIRIETGSERAVDIRITPARKPLSHRCTIAELGRFIGWPEVHNGLVQSVIIHAVAPIDTLGGAACEQNRKARDRAEMQQS